VLLYCSLLYNESTTDRSRWSLGCCPLVPGECPTRLDRFVEPCSDVHGAQIGEIVVASTPNYRTWRGGLTSSCARRNTGQLPRDLHNQAPPQSTYCTNNVPNVFGGDKREELVGIIRVQICGKTAFGIPDVFKKRQKCMSKNPFKLISLKCIRKTFFKTTHNLNLYMHG